MGGWSCDTSRTVTLAGVDTLIHPMKWVDPESDLSGGGPSSIVTRENSFPSCQCLAVYEHHNGEERCFDQAVGCCVFCTSSQLLSGLPIEDLFFYCARCVGHDHHQICEDQSWMHQNPQCRLYSADIEYTSEMIEDMETREREHAEDSVGAEANDNDWNDVVSSLSNYV